MGIMRSILYTTLAFCCIAPFCLAIEPAHQKAIEELLELSGAKEAYDSSVIGAFEAPMANAANQLTEDQKPKFERAMERVKELALEKLGWEVMKPEIVELYAKTFSLEELEAVLPLMRKPEMKSFTAKVTPLGAEAAKIGASKAQSLQPEIIKIIQEEMRP